MGRDLPMPPQSPPPKRHNVKNKGGGGLEGLRARNPKKRGGGAAGGRGRGSGRGGGGPGGGPAMKVSGRGKGGNGKRAPDAGDMGDVRGLAKGTLEQASIFLSLRLRRRRK